MNPRVWGIIGGLALLVAILSPFMMGSSKKIEQLFQSAEDLYGRADYEGAIAKYTEALEASTKRGVNTKVIDKDFTTLVHYKIAVSYSRLAEQSGNVNHYGTAIEFIEKVAPTATIPKHREGLTYLWGHILYRTEQFELAEPKFIEIIEKFPNSLFAENAWYAIGQLNYKLKNYEDSRHAFKAVLARFPRSDFKDDSQHLIAQSYLNESNYEQAYWEFDKLMTEEFKNYPDLQAEAMYKAAYSLNQLGRDDEAIRRYTNFIKLFPESQYVTAAYFDQGAIYEKQKSYRNALINYEWALRATTDRGLQAEIQSAIGRTYFDQEDYDNAVVVYTSLLKKYPESNFVAEAKLGIADSYFRLENWNKAIGAYERVIYEHTELIDFVPYSSYQIGEAYYKLSVGQKNAGQAIRARTTLALALQWYQKTVDNYPQDPVAPHALYGALWTLNDLGQKEDLEIIAREFIEMNKNDSELDLLAAEVQLRFADIKRTEFKQYVEAAEEYAKLWNYRPLPKFHLVKLMGKLFEGRSYYEAAKPEGYQEGDESTNFNEEYLRKSIAAYQEAIEMFADDAFLRGVGAGRYNDFSERVPQVEVCIMNQALSYEMLGKWEQSRNRYASIPYTSEYYERALLLIANTYVREGDMDRAIDYYNSILGKLSNDDYRALAKAKLANLLKSKKQNVPKGTYTAADRQFHNALPKITVMWEEPQINSHEKETYPSKSVPLPPQEIARTALTSTVLVVIKDAHGNPRGIGSGFFISKNLVVSNWHVLKGAFTGHVKLVDGETTYNIEGIVASDPAQDLVVLKVSGVGKSLSLGGSNTVQIGEPIYVTGNPKGWTGTFSEGIVSSIRMRPEGERIQITAPISPGSSGGPLLNNRGQVIGIIYARHRAIDAENLNLAIPVNYLKAVLRQKISSNP